MNSSDFHPRRHARQGGLATLIALSLVVSCAGLAWGQASFTFDPPSPNLTCEENLVIQLELDLGAQAMSGASVSIGFDPAVVTPTSVTRGDLITSASCVSFFAWTNQGTQDATIDVDITLLGCTKSGSGALLNVEFTAPPNEDGVSPLSCSSIRLRDANNQDIPFSCPSEELTINCPVATQPANWSTVKARYRG